MSEIKCCILCVDDHEDTTEMLKLLLAVSDYKVDPAHTVEEALTLARTNEYDLYVLDKRLPDGTGVQLCQDLSRLTPGVPCIFYSGDAYEVHRQQAMAAGADAYVAKPDIDALVDKVHEILSERHCAAEA